MTVAALVDLGVPPSALEWQLLRVDGLEPCHLHFDRVVRCGISGVRFSVHDGPNSCAPPAEEATNADVHGHPDHGVPHRHATHAHVHPPEDVAGAHVHAHGHPHVHGRSWREIRRLLESSALDDAVKTRALSAFRRVAEAEGRIHGIPTDDVGFHEVGALDSIVDIVLASAAIAHLGVGRITASRPRDGIGSIQCAHGAYPVPAPATLEILAGIPLEQIDEPHEMITPTGAAILAEFCESYGPMPPVRVGKTGYGAGSRDFPHRPNVLRAILGETALTSDGADGLERDAVAVLETNVDDTTPEIVGAAMERAFEVGALDVFVTPVQMKKNRPGWLLTAVTPPESVEAVAGVLLKETTAFGVRHREMQRMKLAREIVRVDTVHGEIAVKLGRMAGGIVQISPEYESCLDAARRAGRPLREIYAAAVAAFGDSAAN